MADNTQNIIYQLSVNGNKDVINALNEIRDAARGMATPINDSIKTISDNFVAATTNISKMQGQLQGVVNVFQQVDAATNKAQHGFDGIGDEMEKLNEQILAIQETLAKAKKFNISGKGDASDSMDYAQMSELKIELEQLQVRYKYLSDNVKVNTDSENLNLIVTNKLVDATNNLSIANSEAGKQLNDVKLSIQQITKEQSLMTKGTQEWIDKEVELQALQSQQKAVVKKGVEDVTGVTYEKRKKEIEDEIADIDKSIAKKEAALEKQAEIQKVSVEKEIELNRKKNLEIAEDNINFFNQENAELEKKYLKEQEIIEKSRLLRANQELQGEAYVNTDARKQREQEDKIRADYERKAANLQLKDEADLNAKQTGAGGINARKAEIDALTQSYNNLSEAELKSAQGAQLAGRIRTQKDELAALNQEIAKTPKSVGLADQIWNQFGRTLIRAIPNMVIYGLLFEAVTKVSQAVMEAIPGTDAYIAKQEALIQANEALDKSFDDLIEKLAKYHEEQRLIAQDNLGSDTGSLAEIDRRLEMLKAEGVEKLKQYEYDRKVADLTIEKATKERDITREKIADNLKLQQALQNNVAKFSSDKEKSDYQSTASNPFKAGSINGFDALILSPLAKTNLVDFAAKNIKAHDQLVASIKAAHLPLEIETKQINELDKALKDGSDVTQVAVKQINELKAAHASATSEEKAQTNTINATNKAIEARNQLIDEQILREQKLTLLQQARDTTSLKREGGRNTEDKVRQDVADKYAPQIEQAEETLAKYKLANTSRFVTDDMVQVEEQYEKEIKNLYAQRTIATNNAVKEYQQKVKEQRAQFAAELSKTDADELQTNLLGIPSLQKTFEIITANAKAQKDAKDAEWTAEWARIDKNGLSTYDLAQKQVKELAIIDTKAFKEKIDAITKYYSETGAIVEAGENELLVKKEKATAIDKNFVLESGKSQKRKDKEVERIELHGIIDLEKIRQDNLQKDLNRSKEAQRKYNDELKVTELTNAQILYIQNKIVAEEQKQTNINKSITDSKTAVANALNKLKELGQEYGKLIKDQAIDLAASIANSYMDLANKETEYRQVMAQRSLDWNQKQTNATVQSNQQKMASDKAYYIAQQQLERQKMIDAKNAAETKLTIDFAVASMKIFADDTVDYEMALIEEVGLAGQYAFALGTLASAPVYAKGTDSHPGGMAWVGDGGEHELIKIGNQYSMSPNTPTLTNLPAGAQVIPMSSITNYNGTMGNQLSAPTYSSNNTSGGGNAHLEKMVYSLASTISNISVSLDTHKLASAQKKNYYKNVSL